MNTTFADIMIEQMNNPDCSFLSGMLLGKMTLAGNIGLLLIFFFLFQALNKLAIGPMLDWIKERIYKK